MGFKSLSIHQFHKISIKQFQIYPWKNIVKFEVCTLHSRRNHNYLFQKWFQITADAHPGVSGVSKDQKFCENYKNTHCQVDHLAKIE